MRRKGLIGAQCNGGGNLESNTRQRDMEVSSGAKDIHNEEESVRWVERREGLIGTKYVSNILA